MGETSNNKYHIEGIEFASSEEELFYDAFDEEKLKLVFLVFGPNIPFVKIQGKNDKIYKFLIDYGTEISAIKPEYAVTKFKKKHEPFIAQTSKSQAIVDEYIEGPILREFGINEKIRFSLVPILENCDGILGKPAIRQLNLCMDYGNDVVTDGNVKIPFFLNTVDSSDQIFNLGTDSKTQKVEYEIQIEDEKEQVEIEKGAEYEVQIEEEEEIETENFETEEVEFSKSPIKSLILNPTTRCDFTPVGKRGKQRKTKTKTLISKKLDKFKKEVEIFKLSKPFYRSFSKHFKQYFLVRNNLFLRKNQAFSKNYGILQKKPALILPEKWTKNLQNVLKSKLNSKNKIRIGFISARKPQKKEAMFL
jgi:hypothetical protein